MTHNSSSSSSWDFDMSLGSHHHPLLFDHPTATPPAPPLSFHLHHPPPDPHQHHQHHQHHHHKRYQQHDEMQQRPPPPAVDQQGSQSQLHQQHQDAVDEAEEELGAIKEMMYWIAAMQPVDIDPATIKKPRCRNVRMSENPRSVAARHRRERISKGIRTLQRLVPRGTKMGTASILDEAIRYIKFLKRQVQDLQHQPAPPHQQHYPGDGSSAGPSSTVAIAGRRVSDRLGGADEAGGNPQADIVVVVHGQHTRFRGGGQSSHGMH